jgi:3-mercaptopyruvate sulfurtransferase SseA
MVILDAILGVIMPNSEWQEKVKGILKAELKRRNVSYRDLSQKLEAMGIEESERNINNKISRGGFSAVFLIQALTAIGVKEVRID